MVLIRPRACLHSPDFSLESSGDVNLSRPQRCHVGEVAFHRATDSLSSLCKIGENYLRFYVVRACFEEIPELPVPTAEMPRGHFLVLLVSLVPLSFCLAKKKKEEDKV